MTATRMGALDIGNSGKYATRNRRLDSTAPPQRYNSRNMSEAALKTPARKHTAEISQPAGAALRNPAPAARMGVDPAPGRAARCCSVALVWLAVDAGRAACPPRPPSRKSSTTPACVPVKLALLALVWAYCHHFLRRHPLPVRLDLDKGGELRNRAPDRAGSSSSARVSC